MKVRIYNDILNPAIWDNNKLNPEIKEKLLQIGKDFYADTETDAPLKDVLFVGSLANYNWSDTSDFDVHVVIDFKEVDENVELVEKLVNALKSKWNDEHDIHLKGHNVEVYIQDVNKENRSTGVYSLMQDKWLSEPQKENIEIDKEKIQEKYNDFVRKINSAIKTQDIDKLKSIIKDVYDMRQAGLDKSGELSTENLVFKILRNRNYIEKLKQEIINLYDKKQSLNN
jgi:predicted nucleotidyltransferase